MSPINQLKNHLAEIDDLKHAVHVLGWDQQTYMPPGGGEARTVGGEQQSRPLVKKRTKRCGVIVIFSSPL